MKDFTISCGTRGQTKTIRNYETRIQWCFFWRGTQTLNSCRSLDYARGNWSIIYFNDLCKPIEIYIYARKKHPVTCCPTAKAPRTQQTCGNRHSTKTSGIFSCFPAIILLTWVPLHCKSFLSCSISTFMFQPWLRVAAISLVYYVT